MSSPRQALKAEVSRARIQLLEPMIKGPGGVPDRFEPMIKGHRRFVFQCDGNKDLITDGI